MKTPVYKVILVFFLCFLCLQLSSPLMQAQEPLVQIQKMAEDLRQGCEIKFQLVTKQSGLETHNIRGTLLLWGEKFRLRYDAYDVCFDGKELSYYDFKENTLTLLSSNDEDMLQINPLLFIHQSPEKYVIKYLPVRGGCKVIQLVPKQSKGLYQGIVVTLAGSSNLPKMIEITSSEKVEMKVDLLQIKKRRDFKEMQFIQPKSLYSGCEIVDLR